MERIRKNITLITLLLVLCILGASLFMIFAISCNSRNNFIELNNWFESSGVLNNIIVVNCQDEKMVCKFSCECGTFGTIGYEKPICEIEAKVNQKVSWVPMSENSVKKVYHDYITILLLKKGDVVGYAVLEINLKEDMINYQAKILNQEWLKMTVSENEAKQLVAKIINEKGKDNNAKHYFLSDITKNSTFDITMKSYGGTAYVWSYEIFPSSGIEYVSREFVSDRADPNLTGGGQLKYTFRAMSIGSYKIKFEAQTLSDSNQDSPIEVNIYEITIV